MSFHATSSLSPGDQVLFNKYGRGPTVPLPHTTITGAFQATASAYPNATAVRECFDSGRTLTYAELDARSNVIANYLVQNHGLGPGQRVVCVFSRSVDMCAFIFGVLNTGAQYIPIDGAVMVEDSLRQ
jgi:non-ribosomal peptide synthetase component F